MRNRSDERNDLAREGEKQEAREEIAGIAGPGRLLSSLLWWGMTVRYRGSGRTRRKERHC